MRSNPRYYVVGLAFVVAVCANGLLVPVTAVADLEPEGRKEIEEIAGWPTFSSCMSTRARAISTKVDNLYRSQRPLKKRDPDRMWTDEEKQVVGIVLKQVDICRDLTIKELLQRYGPMRKSR